MAESAHPVAEACAAAGLNALGWTTTSENAGLDVLLVLGSGGGTFAREAFAAHPGPDPIDSHGAALALRLQELLAAEALVLSVHTPSSLPAFDMAAAARRTGMGVQGRLGILMHPTFGPWWGLRLAITLRSPSLVWRDTLLDAMRRAGLRVTSGSKTPTSPCDACVRRPCVAACPAGAVSSTTAQDGARPPTFALLECVAHVAQGGCAQRCAARAACPEGAAYRYPEWVHTHHHQSFRRALAERL